MSESRMEVLKELLFELDEICKNNGLKYTLTGEFALMAHTKKQFPKEFDYITIAMTMGDIERLIKIVNTSNSHRQVEYILNNPHATGLQIRYCNSDTTLINIKEFGTHVNYGFFIRIRPIVRVVKSRKKRKLLKLFKRIWNRSSKRIRSCSYGEIIQVILAKNVIRLIGKKRAAHLLYTYDKKLKYIDKWENLSDYKKIKIGTEKFVNVPTWDLKYVNVGGKQLLFTECVVNRAIEKIPIHRAVEINEIEKIEVPFNEVLNVDRLGELRRIQKIRDEYFKSVTKAKPSTIYIRNAWNIYLMTRDIIYLRKLYSESEVLKISMALDNKNYETYWEGIRPYIETRKKWRKLKIPFLEILELERIESMAKDIFD